MARADVPNDNLLICIKLTGPTDENRPRLLRLIKDKSVKAWLFEIVNDDFGAVRLEAFLHEFQVERMDLVIVLRLFGIELDVKRHLVGLIDNGAVTGRHSADVKRANARDGFEVLIGARDKVLRGLRLVRIGPENDNVRKHWGEIVGGAAGRARLK